MYAKAGYAAGRTNVRLIEGAGAASPDTPGVTADVTGWKGGWTLGAGLEYTPWPNIVLGLEFDFYNFAFDTKVPQLFNDGVTTFQILGSNADVYAFTARLSYLFNWGKVPAAVVARY